MNISSPKETLVEVTTSIVVASEIDKDGKHIGVAWVEPCTSPEEDKSAVFDDLIDLLNQSEDKQITLKLGRDDYGTCVLYAEDDSGICTEYKSIQNRGKSLPTINQPKFSGPRLK